MKRRILLKVSVLFVLTASISGAKIAPKSEVIASNEIEEEVAEEDKYNINDNNSWAKFGSDFMYALLKLTLKAGLVTEEDLKVHFLPPKDGQRQARSDNPLSELAFTVFKEVASEFLAATVGSYLGFETERTSEDFNILSMILGAVRKNTLQKRMGCPT